VRLFHYTCRHSLGGIISARGTLRPNPFAGRQIVMERAGFHGYAYPVVWVTDVDVVCREDAAKIGLQAKPGSELTCDRVQWRFLVPNVGLVPWTEWADRHHDEWAPPAYRALLEAAEGAEPARWWVAAKPVPGCRLDQRYRAPRW
jgi:hypothetical protein